MSGKDSMISTVDLQSKKLVSREVGEASRDDDQPIVGPSENVGIIIHKRTRSGLSSRLEEKVKSLEDSTFDEDEQDTKPLIQKVPFVLLDNKNFQKYYEPRVVAIGPIHHCNPKLNYAEKLKLRLAGDFIKENRLDRQVLCNTITRDLENLKKCYDENVIECYDDDDLAWMFLVDGCAILHFIHCVVDKEDVKTENNFKLKRLNLKNDHVAFAQRDMFLLENQLPYRVLKLLISSFVHDIQKGQSLIASIDKFIHRNMMVNVKAVATITPAAKAATPAQQSPEKEPFHLLDLLREKLIKQPDKRENVFMRLIARLKSTLFSRDSNERIQFHSFCSVNELQASGIQLKPSDTGSLKDISFNHSCYRGTLKLPPLMVDDSTAPKFLNLIAYEMCPDFMNEFEVTSYISFLDSLIDQPEDVKELRKGEILHNLLGSDEEVAKIFNEIGTDLVPNPRLYYNVKNAIEKHYKSRCTAHIAEFIHNHFSSPWTILAFLGAIVALVLGLLQTIYSILSYHKAD